MRGEVWSGEEVVAGMWVGTLVRMGEGCRRLDDGFVTSTVETE